MKNRLLFAACAIACFAPDAGGATGGDKVIAGTIPPPAPPESQPVPESPELTPEDHAAIDAGEKNLTPEEKEANAKLDAKDSHHLETEAKPEPVHQGTIYVGPVTCTSTSFETGEAVSARIVLPEPVHEDKVFYAFTQHHPSARRSDFKIDAGNTDPSDLKTRKE